MIRSYNIDSIHYYPFALVMNQKNYSTPMSQKNKYLYNGKELQNNEFGTKGFGIYEHITLAYNTGKACNIYSTEAQPGLFFLM